MMQDCRQIVNAYNIACRVIISASDIVKYFSLFIYLFIIIIFFFFFFFSLREKSLTFHANQK